ncbi:MAG: 2-hydroxyacid dehydrogenase [bacterium]
MEIVRDSGKACFLDLGSVHPDDLSLAKLEDVAGAWQWWDETSVADRVSHIGPAQTVLTNKVVLDRRVFEQCHNLRLVCIAATGYNHVDLEAAADHEVAVCNVTAYATAAVAQHVLSLILALRTNLMAYREDVRQGLWQQSEQFCRLDHPIVELAGQTLGIIGYGELGQAVARLAEAFGMRVLVANRPGGPPVAGRLDLDQLLPEVDVLSLHVPLAENTRDMIGGHELALMKSDALLINTARGGLVDEPALADALLNNKLGGAGIDVLSTEPPRDGNVLLDLDLPNLILTPHTAWASRQARQRLLDEIAENIAAFQRGELRNRLV